MRAIPVARAIEASPVETISIEYWNSGRVRREVFVFTCGRSKSCEEMRSRRVGSVWENRPIEEEYAPDSVHSVSLPAEEMSLLAKRIRLSGFLGLPRSLFSHRVSGGGDTCILIQAGEVDYSVYTWEIETEPFQEIEWRLRALYMRYGNHEAWWKRRVKALLDRIEAEEYPGELRRHSWPLFHLLNVDKHNRLLPSYDNTGWAVGSVARENVQKVKTFWSRWYRENQDSFDRMAHGYATYKQEFLPYYEERIRAGRFTWEDCGVGEIE